MWRRLEMKSHKNINGEVAKISTLSSGKVDKYKYLTGEEILIIEQAKFTYSPLGKTNRKKKLMLKVSKPY